MQRRPTNPWLPASAMLAAAAVTVALGGVVHAMFVPASTAIGAQAIAAQRARPATQVAILPARIEVVGMRAAEIASPNGKTPAAVPRG